MVESSRKREDAAFRPISPLSNLDLCAEFLRLEEESDLFHLKVDGAFFWEYVRFYVLLELQRCLRLSDVEPFQPEQPLRRWLKRLLSSAAGLWPYNPFLTSRKPLLFFGCPRRTRDGNGVWWDTCVDPCLESLTCPYYYIERYNHDRHHTPARTRDVKYHDLLSMLACGYRVATYFRDFTSEENLLLLQIQERLSRRFGVTVDVRGIARPILKTRRCLLYVYEHLFRLVRPRAVFFASINYPERTAIEVCKKLGIPAVELQHGVIGPGDLCYVYPRNAPVRCFPDYLLVFGQYWKDCIPFPLPPERVLPIGFPYLEARKQRYAKVEKLNQVVFLSQPPVGVELSHFAVRLAQSDGFPCRVVYRLHPYESDWQTRYPWLDTSRITVSDTRQEDLYAVLARSKMQVGVHSAALFEGLTFGLQTYLLDLPGVENVEHLVKLGFARKVSEPRQIVCDRGPARPIDPEAFFRSHGLQHFADAIRMITGGPFVG